MSEFLIVMLIYVLIVAKENKPVVSRCFLTNLLKAVKYYLIKYSLIIKVQLLNKIRK